MVLQRIKACTFALSDRDIKLSFPSLITDRPILADCIEWIAVCKIKCGLLQNNFTSSSYSFMMLHVVVFLF